MVETGRKVNIGDAAQAFFSNAARAAMECRRDQSTKAALMLRSAIRFTGYAVLAAGMALGVHDGARSISVSGLEVTPLGALALWLLPRHFPILEPAVARHVHPLLWDPVLLTVFLTPAVVALFAVGGLLMAFGRPAAPTAIASP
jgi:hypothetical protein